MIKATLLLLMVFAVFGWNRKENQAGNLDWILSPEKSQQINLNILNELQGHLENWKVVDTSAIKRAKQKPILFKIMSRRNSKDFFKGLFKHALGGKHPNPEYEYIGNGKTKHRKNTQFEYDMDMQKNHQSGRKRKQELKKLYLDKARNHLEELEQMHDAMLLHLNHHEGLSRMI